MAAAATYDPKRAWLRAACYFGACLLVGYASGALEAALAPLATPEQLSDPWWWALTALFAAVIVIGYAVVWPIGTFTDGRRRHAVVQLAYGSAWGLCQGLLFVSIWLWIERSGLRPLWVAILCYLAIGAYNGVWHRFVWDIYVSPPHNYTEWNARKVLLCHTPNLVVGLTCLALYRSFGIYILLQGVALAASAWFMRFPAPWDDYTAVAGAERSLAKPAGG